MIGIRAIASHVPSGRIDNVAAAARFGFDEAFVREKLGFTALARKPPEQKTSDLAVAAVRQLAQKHGIAADRAQCLVVVTQNPDDRGLPHTSAIVHRKLGLGPSCFAFDISLGCSGYVAALAIVTGFLKSAGLERALLVTADPYSEVVDPEDRNTALLFGDAAAATYLAPDPVLEIGGFDLGTVGSAADALKVADGRLSMNGRAVYDFALREVPPGIERLLRASGLSAQAVDRVLLHPGSRYIVDALARRLGLGRPLFPAADYGNTVSSSLPLMLEDELDRGAAATIVASGFGVGLSWATTLLRRS